VHVHFEHCYLFLIIVVIASYNFELTQTYYFVFHKQNSLLVDFTTKFVFEKHYNHSYTSMGYNKHSKSRLNKKLHRYTTQYIFVENEYEINKDSMWCCCKSRHYVFVITVIIIIFNTSSEGDRSILHPF